MLSLGSQSLQNSISRTGTVCVMLSLCLFSVQVPHKHLKATWMGPLPLCLPLKKKEKKKTKLK